MKQPETVLNVNGQTHISIWRDPQNLRIIVLEKII